MTGQKAVARGAGRPRIGTEIASQKLPASASNGGKELGPGFDPEMFRIRQPELSAGGSIRKTSKALGLWRKGKPNNTGGLKVNARHLLRFEPERSGKERL